VVEESFITVPLKTIAATKIATATNATFQTEPGVFSFNMFVRPLLENAEDLPCAALYFFVYLQRGIFNVLLRTLQVESVTKSPQTRLADLRDLHGSTA
jgi:hypothetical protein